MVSPDISIALIPPFIYAMGNIFGKKATITQGGFYGAVLTMGFGVIPILFFVLSSPLHFNSYAIVLGTLAGTLLGAGTVLFFRSLDTQQVSNAIVFVLLQQVLTALFSIYGLGESFGIIDIAASVFIIIGIFLVSVNRKFKFNRLLLPALVANILWTLYWVVTSYAISMGQDSNTLLLIGRISGTIVIVAAYLLLRKTGKAIRSRPWQNVYGAVSGVLNGLGTIAYAYLVPLGIFALGSILASLNPGITAVLAYLVFRERLTKMQLTGLVIATVGAVVLAVYA